MYSVVAFDALLRTQGKVEMTARVSAAANSNSPEKYYTRLRAGRFHGYAAAQLPASDSNSRGNFPIYPKSPPLAAIHQD